MAGVLASSFTKTAPSQKFFPVAYCSFLTDYSGGSAPDSNGIPFLFPTMGTIKDDTRSIGRKISRQAV